MVVKKKTLLFSLLMGLSMILAACGGSSDPAGTETEGGDSGSNSSGEEETYHWRFVTEEMEGEVQYEYAVEFANRLKEKSDGRITMDVFQFGGLGSEVDQVEQLQDGYVEFAIVSPGFTGTMVDAGQLFALHFLFSDDMEVNQEILNTSEALNVHLAEKYIEHNIQPLAFWTEGAMQWTGSRELRTPADFENFKMRTQESPLIQESYKAYGANPTAMSWGELYTSLQQGVVEGQENPIFFIESANFHEVQEHMTLSRHNIYVAMTTVNPEFFAGLPEDIQNMILETVEEMRPVAYEMQKEMNESLLQNIIDSEEFPTEVIELTEEERSAFREKALPVRDFFVEEVVDEDGKEILELLQQEIEAAENK